MYFCVISFIYPAACRPKAHGSSSATAEDAAVGFYITLSCPRSSWPFILGLPSNPNEKRNKKQRKARPKRNKRKKKTRLSKPVPPLLPHSARPGLVHLLRFRLPFVCRRGIWERVLGRVAFASPSAWGGGRPPSLGLLLGLSLHRAYVCLGEVLVPAVPALGRHVWARETLLGSALVNWARCSAVAYSSSQREYLGVLAVQRGPTWPHAQHRPQKTSGLSSSKGSILWQWPSCRIPLLPTVSPSTAKRPKRPRFSSPGSGPGNLCLSAT